MAVPVTSHPRWKSFTEDLNKLNLRFPNAILSEKLGYSSGNVSAFIKGRKMPSGKFLEKFYEIYYDDITKAEEEIERKRKEKHANNPNPIPFCPNCIEKDKEIAFLKGQVDLLTKLLQDNNKSKAISA